MAVKNTTAESNDINKVYTIYKTTISEIIANIEVYEHDLPKDVMAQISEIFQTIASYENAMQGDKQVLWNAINETYSTVIESLYKNAIFLLMRKIHEYDKMFSRYNYKGVMIADNKFIELARSEKNSISEALHLELKKCYSGKLIENVRNLSWKGKFKYLGGYFYVLTFPRRYKKEIYIPKDDLENINLKEIYEKAKGLLKLYQKICPEVLKNGAKVSYRDMVAKVVISWMIPIGLGINAVLKWNGIDVVSRFVVFVERAFNK